jgi:hypothetical protein
VTATIELVALSKVVGGTAAPPARTVPGRAAAAPGQAAAAPGQAAADPGLAGQAGQTTEEVAMPGGGIKRITRFPGGEMVQMQTNGPNGSFSSFSFSFSQTFGA